MHNTSFSLVREFVGLGRPLRVNCRLWVFVERGLAGQPWLFMQPVLTLGDPNLETWLWSWRPEFGDPWLWSWKLVTVKRISSGSKTGSKAECIGRLGIKSIWCWQASIYSSATDFLRIYTIKFLVQTFLMFFGGEKIVSLWNAVLVSSLENCPK